MPIERPERLALQPQNFNSPRLWLFLGVAATAENPANRAMNDFRSESS
jgi:hypothetical protein